MWTNQSKRYTLREVKRMSESMKSSHIFFVTSTPPPKRTNNDIHSFHSQIKSLAKAMARRLWGNQNSRRDGSCLLVCRRLSVSLLTKWVINRICIYISRRLSFYIHKNFSQCSYRLPFFRRPTTQNCKFFTQNLGGKKLADLKRN